MTKAHITTEFLIAEADGVTTDDIIRALLDATPVDGSDEETVKQMDAVMR